MFKIHIKQFLLVLVTILNENIFPLQHSQIYPNPIQFQKWIAAQFAKISKKKHSDIKTQLNFDKIFILSNIYPLIIFPIMLHYETVQFMCKTYKHCNSFNTLQTIFSSFTIYSVLLFSRSSINGFISYQYLRQLYIKYLIIKQKKKTEIFMKRLATINQNQNMDNSAIKELKQKLHKSFMELSNMEQLCREELQSQKLSYQKIIQELQNENLMLKTKLKEVQPINSDKTDNLFLDIDQSMIMNKKTSKFIQDESFLDLMKGTNINDIFQYMMGLENDVKKQLKIIPVALTQYFENCQIVARQSSTIYQDLQKSREKIQRIQIQHFTQIQTLKQQNQRQLSKLKQQNKKLRAEKDKLYFDYEKLNAMYQTQLKKVENYIKEKKVMKLNNSSSLKDIRQVKNQENCDNHIWCSQKTTDSDANYNSGLLSPKFLRTKNKRVVGY